MLHDACCCRHLTRSGKHRRLQQQPGERPLSAIPSQPPDGPNSPEEAALRGDGWTGWQSTRGGAKTGKLIGHLSQTTRATGEGKYGSCMQAEPPNASWMQPDPLSWTRPRTVWTVHPFWYTQWSFQITTVQYSTVARPSRA